jgi:hypothetical protein
MDMRKDTRRALTFDFAHTDEFHGTSFFSIFPGVFANRSR